MIERKKQRTANVAFFSVVHEVYFEQFEGLKESLTGYHNETIKLIEKNEVNVKDYGIVGSNSKAFDVASEIIRPDFLIFSKSSGIPSNIVFSKIPVTLKYSR